MPLHVSGETSGHTGTRCFQQTIKLLFHQVCLESGKVLAHRDTLLLPFHEGGQLFRYVHRTADDILHRGLELGRMCRFEKHTAFALTQPLA